MTRLELLEIAKPILFNTEMVRAILNNEKSATRRLCRISSMPASRKAYSELYYKVVFPETNIDGLCAQFFTVEGYYRGCAKPPYQVGDYLYIRETWNINWLHGEYPWEPKYIYKATDNLYKNCEFESAVPKCYLKWRPSIHMPKEAARIFLRVTDVRVERLQDITDEQAIDEGCKGIFANVDWVSTPREEYVDVWNSTVKKSDLDKYGWNANPWVWVIEFERVEVE